MLESAHGGEYHHQCWGAEVWLVAMPDEVLIFAGKSAEPVSRSRVLNRIGNGTRQSESA